MESVLVIRFYQTVIFYHLTNINQMKKFIATIAETYITKFFDANNEKEAKSQAKEWAKSIPGNYCNFRIKIQEIL